MLTFAGVSKRYGDARALGPIDLEIARGTTVALIGPSGGGKSTLLRLAAGLIAPDGGRVALDGTEVPARDGEAMRSLRRRLGYVIQDGGLFPHLDAAGNATLVARWLGWPAAKIAARARELAELARFPAELLGRLPGELSGGQRQRVSLMRALLLDPDVLLLDEPLGALDPMIRRELQDDLRRIFRREPKKTVVLVTHDLAEAAFFADRLVLLSEGRIEQAGTLDDLARAPATPFVTRFLEAQRPAIDLGARGATSP